MLSLRHPLCGVERCCLTTLSLSFLAQAFSGLGATLSLIKCLAPSLQWKRRIRTVQQYRLNSSSCNANTCGDTWRDKASVRKEREKVVAPSTTSSFDTYRCTGTGAEGCSAWHVGIRKYLPKDSEYHYLYSATCFVLCSTIFKILKNWARVFRNRNLKLELCLDTGIKWSVVAAACSEAFTGSLPVSQHKLGCSGLRFYFWNPCVVSPLPPHAKSQPCLLISFWFSILPTSLMFRWAIRNSFRACYQLSLWFQQLGRLTFRGHKQLHFPSLLLSNK